MVVYPDPIGVTTAGSRSCSRSAGRREQRCVPEYAGSNPRKRTRHTNLHALLERNEHVSRGHHASNACRKRLVAAACIRHNNIELIQTCFDNTGK